MRAPCAFVRYVVANGFDTNWIRTKINDDQALLKPIDWIPDSFPSFWSLAVMRDWHYGTVLFAHGHTARRRKKIQTSTKRRRRRDS